MKSRVFDEKASYSKRLTKTLILMENAMKKSEKEKRVLESKSYPSPFSAKCWWRQET
jgi:hypothetical protein